MNDFGWRDTFFLEIRRAVEILGCSWPDMDDHIKAGRVRVSKLPGHRWPRRVFTEDITALYGEKPQEVTEPLPLNASLGDYPGCGACLRMCATCRRVQSRCQYPVNTGDGQRHGLTWLLTDYEAFEILGFYPQGGFITFLRKNKVAIDVKRTNHRVAWNDLIRVKQQHVLASIDIQEERRGVVNALEQMIELRWREMMEVDTELTRYSVGFTTATFRYGHVVDQDAPPDSLWYVYHLCHPSGRPFYVGKGTGNRMYQHEKEAVQGKGNNPYKCAVIRKLLKRGDRVRYRVVFVTPEESEAYEYEIQEIARLGGYKKLTNLTPGGATREEYNRVFGSRVPQEQRNYRQFADLLALYPTFTPEERRTALRNWAYERIFALERLRVIADSLSYHEAVQKIDAEIESCRPYTARQQSFSELRDRNRRYFYDAEWR